MAATNSLWEREQRFWLDGSDFYREHMTRNALMVFPKPVGILKGDEVLQSLKGAPRWKSVDLDRRSIAEAGDTTVLAYEATGLREGGEPYSALCCSTYVKDGGRWKLLAHQQTPL